jgi:hypothetical protein
MEENPIETFCDFEFGDFLYPSESGAKAATNR